MVICFDMYVVIKLLLSNETLKYNILRQIIMPVSRAAHSSMSSNVGGGGCGWKIARADLLVLYKVMILLYFLLV